jgi:hypothetical protein
LYRNGHARKGRTYSLTSLMRCGLRGGRMRSLQREGAPELEEYVRDLICGMLADPVTRAAMARINCGDDMDGDSSLMECRRKIDKRRQRLIDLYSDGDIDRSSFRTCKGRLDDEAREIEAQIANRTGTRVLAEVQAPTRKSSLPGRSEASTSSAVASKPSSTPSS